jgi:hypothetical protein
MKKKWGKIGCICLLIYGCISCEGVSNIMHIHNNSDEAIYVYFQCGETDSLPIAPKLDLFILFNNDNERTLDASGNPLNSGFVWPDYRIDAYSTGTLKGELEGRVWRSSPSFRFPCEGNEATLFFITEKTMRNYSWDEIYKDQMYVKKTTLTKDELMKNDWLYTYEP